MERFAKADRALERLESWLDWPIEKETKYDPGNH